jgi:hypothetical protein
MIVNGAASGSASASSATRPQKKTQHRTSSSTLRGPENPDRSKPPIRISLTSRQQGKRVCNI